MTKPVPVAASGVRSRSSSFSLRSPDRSRSPPGGGPKKRRNSSPPKNSFILTCGRYRSVQMVTTTGVCASAMSRKVVAVRFTADGGLFDAGLSMSCCAASGGVRS